LARDKTHPDRPGRPDRPGTRARPVDFPGETQWSFSLDHQETAHVDNRSFLIHLFYDCVFLLLIVVSLPILLVRIAFSRRFRAGLFQRIGFVPDPKAGGGMLWIHGVSVGEVKTIQPLLAHLEEEFGPLPCAISTTTQAGFQIARKLFADKFTFYFPLDISFIVRRVLRRIRPGLIILMELEIWPNLLYEANKMGTEVIIVNGRISEKSFRGYSRIRRLLPELNRIALFSVQNDEYRRRLLNLDVPPGKVVITGNIKYDGIDSSEAADAVCVRRDLCLGAGTDVLVAGSTHHGEDDILLELYKELRRGSPELRLILAPRHLERLVEIERACSRFGLKARRKTQLLPGSAEIGSDDVLLLDTIGELESVYAAADLVFVGGSLVDVGGHNMLEPAGKGRAVIYGPHVYNFVDEAALLESRGAAIRVADGSALGATIRRLLDDPEERHELGRRALDALSDAKGAAEVNVGLIRDHFAQRAGDLFTRGCRGE
jgi:3-deoxy-D-manno-octulosonic-acid transferase